jgi:hypothetical protein
MMNTDGTGFTPVFSDTFPNVGAFGLDVTSNGAYLMIVSSIDYTGQNPNHAFNLFRLPTDNSTAPRQVTFAPEQPCGAGLACNPFLHRMSYDGQRVVYLKTYTIGAGGCGIVGLFRRDIGGTEEQLVPATINCTEGVGNLLDVSSDASTILFLQNNDLYAYTE